jgi:Do/DeqQ family serine protease
MDTNRRRFATAIPRGVLAAALAAALFVGGAKWQSLAAAPEGLASQKSSVQDAPVLPPRTARVDSYADIVTSVGPGVVTIRVEGKAQVSPANFQGDEFFRRFFGDQFDSPRGPQTFRQRGLGSGVIVSADGYILTNHHVVDGADDIRVDLADGRTLPARLVGSDAPSDLALLKVDATQLHALRLGDSSAVQVGDVVLALGNPLGVGQTVTMGIVSAKGRSTGVGDGSYEDFLQTDAPINQGNSGGALINTKGEVIGINSQILSPSGGNIGIGFAIPSNMAQHVLTLLRTEGRVRRGQLGVTVQPVTSDLAASLGLHEARGAIVSSIERGSAADHAGLKREDVITAFNGQAVDDANALRNQVADAAPGSHAAVTIVRNGAERQLTVELGEAPSSQANHGAETRGENGTAFGVSVVPLTPQIASRMNLPAETHGLVVQDVNPDSSAADAGLQPGDVIEEVNSHSVTSAGDLRAQLRRASERPALLLVNRDGHELFLTARAS